MMELSTVLFALSSILIVCLIRKFTKKYGSLEAMGIPVIKPFLCFGSPPFGLHKIVWHKWYLEKHQQLGTTFGLYNGASPIIITTDPDIIKCVYVKNFEEFGDMVDNPHYDDSMKTIDLAQGTLIPIGRYCPTNIIQANPYKSWGSGYPVDPSV